MNLLCMCDMSTATPRAVRGGFVYDIVWYAHYSSTSLGVTVLCMCCMDTTTRCVAVLYKCSVVHKTYMRRFVEVRRMFVNVGLELFLLAMFLPPRYLAVRILLT